MKAEERRPLADLVVKLQRGQSYKSAQIGAPGPFLLGLGTIHRHGGFRDENLRTYGGDTPDNILLAPGDLYLSLKDMTHAAELLGAVSRVPKGIYGRLTQDTIKLEADEGRIDQNYLYWVLRDPRYRDYCRMRGTGTTNLDLSRSDFLAYDVYLPPKGEQQAIAEVLGALDDKIAANTHLVETADELARSLTRAALTGERVDLASVAEITMGSSPPGTSYNEEANGVVFYQGVRDFGVRFPSNRVWTTEPVRMAEPGDTLLSVRAPVGRTNLAAESTCIGRWLAAVRSVSGHPMTMFHFLRDDRAAWAPYEAEGTVFGSINKKQLASLQIATVRPEEREKLERSLAALEQRIAAAIHESERLAATRDVLLPLLMSGGVIVKDAEAVVEEAV